MSTATKRMVLTLDRNRQTDALIEQDGGGLWHTAKLPPMIYGDRIPVAVRIATLTAGGVATLLPSAAGSTMSLVGVRRNLKGDPLYSIASLTYDASTPATPEWTGTLELGTDELYDIFSLHSDVGTRMEIALRTDEDVEIGTWQIDVAVLKRAYMGDPPEVVGGPTFYNTAETNALFARRDGPTGYGMKMVVYGGLLYWAHLVGDTWVIPRIISVNGQNVWTFTEVE